MLIDSEIETAIARVTPEIPVDELCETLIKLETFLARGRELKKQLDAALFDWIKANDKPVLIGQTMYAIDSGKEVTCTSIRDTTEALLKATGGDVDAFCTALSVNAFRHGACKKLLDPDTFDTCFAVEIKEKLTRTEDEKKIKKLNMEFVR